jgi:hypothetical protein
MHYRCEMERVIFNLTPKKINCYTNVFEQLLGIHIKRLVVIFSTISLSSIKTLKAHLMTVKGWSNIAELSLEVGYVLEICFMSIWPYLKSGVEVSSTWGTNLYGILCLP